MLSITSSIISIWSINLNLPNETSYKIRGLEDITFHCMWDIQQTVLCVTLGCQYLYDLMAIWLCRKWVFCLCPVWTVPPDIDLIGLMAPQLWYTQGLHIKTGLPWTGELVVPCTRVAADRWVGAEIGFVLPSPCHPPVWGQVCLEKGAPFPNFYKGTLWATCSLDLWKSHRKY